MQRHLHEHFTLPGQSSFLHGVPITLIDKSDPSCPTKHEDFWILNGIQCSWVQIPVRPTFCNYF